MSENNVVVENETVEGIELLGNEMLTWSDIDGEVGAFGGLLAPHLLHHFGGSRGRVLIAGPTGANVITDVASHFEHADVLVRSYPDAQKLRAALPASIGVVCGPLNRLARQHARYDAVVAVAGTDRLHSAEEDTPTAAQVLADLAELVAEGGELFLTIGNPVGIDRLLSLGAEARHGDAHWPDGSAEAVGGLALMNVDETLAALVGNGLSRVETWHCHGRRSEPLIAAPSGAFARWSRDDVLVRLIAHAYDVVDPSAPPIKDPATTARDLVRAGLGASTAPTTIVHVRRGGHRDEPADSILVQEPVQEGSPAVAYRLTSDGGSWTRTLLVDPATISVTPALRRDTALLSGPVPSGATLADTIEACLAAHDVSSAGELVRRYRDWLGASADDGVLAERVAVTPSRLAVGENGLALIDGSWVAQESAPRDVVLVRGLLDVAADLLARGVRHPWSPVASARSVASSMAAAAGLEFLPIEGGSAVLDAALALDARLRPEGAVPNYDEPGNLGRLSYAELVELARTSAQHAAEADEHVFWLLRQIQGRQRGARVTAKRLRAIECSWEMWFGRRMMVLPALWRKLKQKRRELIWGKPGEWKDNSKRQPAPGSDTDLVPIEEQFLPPGYKLHPRVEVVPDSWEPARARRRLYPKRDIPKPEA